MRVILMTALMLGLLPRSQPVAAAGSVPPGFVFAGTYRITYYWISEEDQRYVDQPRSEILLDVAGCELARVSTAFRRSLDLEGTGRLLDGRLLNVAEKTPAGWRYVDLGVSSWGLGVRGIPLIPFRSLAADPRHLSTGTTIFLPSFSGLEILDDFVHGGYFVVDDVGSAIREKRIDLFIGDRSRLALFESLVPSHGRLEVWARRPH